MPFIPRCLATGIGSVPFQNPSEALNLVMEKLEEIPHWPQLALPGEELINQYLSPLVELGLVVQPDKGAPYFDTTQEDWLDKLTNFYALYLEAEETGEIPELFSFPAQLSLGFYSFIEKIRNCGSGKAQYLKGQVTGPVTLGLQLVDQDRRSSYYNPELRDVVVKSLSLQARWQAQTLSKFGLPVLIFIDEPSLYGYGMSTHVTLKREEIIEELNFVIEGLKSGGALAGVHVCANTDWSLILATGIDVVSFDAYQYFQGFSLYTDNIKDFLNRGGVLAWGLVPTSEKIMNETTETIWKLFQEQLAVLEGKGMERRKVLEQSLITPSCGTASIGINLAVKVYQALTELSLAIRTKLA